jgi:hypothetical protein
MDQYPSLAAAHELDKKKNASSQSMSGGVGSQRQHQSSPADLVASPASGDASVPSDAAGANGMDAGAIVPEFTESLFDIGFRLVMRYNGLLDPFAEIFNLPTGGNGSGAVAPGNKSGGDVSAAAAAGGVRQKALDTVSRSRFDRMMGGDNGSQLAGGEQQYMVNTH